MTYLTAEQAVEYGLIDRVLTSQKLPTPACQPALASARAIPVSAETGRATPAA